MLLIDCIALDDQSDVTAERRSLRRIIFASMNAKRSKLIIQFFLREKAVSPHCFGRQITRLTDKVGGFGWSPASGALGFLATRQALVYSRPSVFFIVAIWSWFRRLLS